MSTRLRTIIFSGFQGTTDSIFLLQVPAQKLTKMAFWTQVDEERLASQTLVDNLMDRFGTKPIAKENQVNGDDDGAYGGSSLAGESLFQSLASVRC